MNTMELTVKVFDTDEKVTVTPMAVFGLDDFSTIYVTDAAACGLTVILTGWSTLRKAISTTPRP